MGVNTIMLDDVMFNGATIKSAHFTAPAPWKARFAPGIRDGWVTSNTLPRVLACFRTTPGAKLSENVSNITGIKETLRNISNLGPNENEIFNIGWGEAVLACEFSQTLLDTPILGFTRTQTPVYPFTPIINQFSVADLVSLDAKKYMGELVPKSSDGMKKFNTKLDKLWGGRSVWDALNNFPRTYRDLTKEHSTNGIKKEGIEDTVVFNLRSYSSSTTKTGLKILIVKGTLRGSNEPFEVAIFGDSHEQETALAACGKGEQIIAFGRVSYYNETLTLKNPWIFPLNLFQSSMFPIYSGSTTVKTTPMVAKKITEGIISKFAQTITDPLPAWLMSKRGLVTRKEAYKTIHSPENWAQRTQARKRLAYDELLRLQAHINEIKNGSAAITKPTKHCDTQKSWEWVNTLPFQITKDQKTAIEDILNDLESETAMRRLIMGDVGSGKTTVAQAASIAIVSAGRQVAVMAPNSVLAEQLYKEFSLLPANVELLSGNITTKKNRKLLEAVKTGDINIVIGTHTLLSDNLEWADLGLIIVDEQHKFGVDQRAKLLKNTDSNFMMMSATPIPSSIAAISYGDLQMSIIKELPPGRQPIETVWVNESGENIVNDKTHPIWDDVRREAEMGNRVYIISTLVEWSSDRASVESTAEKLTKMFGNNVVALHGKMKTADKQEAIEKFKSGETPIMVASSVVEVGVNVPEATMEIVLDATRFGLASLHQLRGRIGRGSLPSKCVLVGIPSESNPEKSESRMRIMMKHSSGFDVSEEDFMLRGEGEFFGSQQSGKSDLGLVSLRTDGELLNAAREDFLELDEGVKAQIASELKAAHDV